MSYEESDWPVIRRARELGKRSAYWTAEQFDQLVEQESAKVEPRLKDEFTLNMRAWQTAYRRAADDDARISYELNSF